MKRWGVLCVFMAVMVLPGVCQSAEQAKGQETSVTLREVVVTGTRFVSRRMDLTPEFRKRITPKRKPLVEFGDLDEELARCR